MADSEYKEINNPFRSSGPKMDDRELIRRLNQLVIDLNAKLKELQDRIDTAGIP